jgi:hypothetical protein
MEIVSTAKEELHELVDDLPEAEVVAARRYLQYLRDMRDPVLRSVQEASLDDEPVTAEEEAAVAVARAQVERGEVVSHDEMKRRLGL